MPIRLLQTLDLWYLWYNVSLEARLLAVAHWNVIIEVPARRQSPICSCIYTLSAFSMSRAQARCTILALLPPLILCLGPKFPMKRPIQTSQLPIVSCMSSLASVIEGSSLSIVLFREALPCMWVGVREESQQPSDSDMGEDVDGVCSRSSCNLNLTLVRHPTIVPSPIISHLIHHPICNLHHHVVPALSILPLSLVWKSDQPLSWFAEDRVCGVRIV